MALQQLQLDDLTWTEMVANIRRRIPAASAGEWTLHSPVDPGVTLLELFAYLLEQRVFFLDQIPDSLLHAGLSLMGEAIRPAVPASTVLRFSPREFVKVNSLTELRLVRKLPPLVFSTDYDVLVLPCEEASPGRYRVGLIAGGLDRSLDLALQRPTCLLPACDSAGEVRIELSLTERIPASSTGAFFSLLIELQTSERISPQWSSSAIDDVRPPATLSFGYMSSSSGKLEQFPPDAVKDGTAGLRRSGIVSLRIPPNWQHGQATSGTWPYTVVIRIENATFTAPPVVTRIVPNVVSARHRRLSTEHLLSLDWLPLPGNTLRLLDLYTDAPAGSGVPPLQDYPPLDDSIRLTISERDGDFDWRPTTNLTFHGPDERVFTVDREKGLLRFGDGVTGRVPVVDRTQDPNLRLQYFAGGGEAGNLGSDLAFESVADADLRARNIVPAQGGSETESLDSARRRAASVLRHTDRAVTARDHENIVISTPGIAFARAYAALGHHPAHPCSLVPGAITVYVVPEAPRLEGNDYDQDCAWVEAPVPDQGALQAARARIERARLVGNEVFVSAAEYRCVSLLIEARGDPLDPGALSERIRVALRKFLDPLRGGTQKSGWPFGEALRPSVLLSEAQRAAGDDANIVSVGIGLDNNPPSENCKDVEIKPHQLVVLKDAVLHLQSDPQSQGGLR